jgi:hypothetical protein
MENNKGKKRALGLIIAIIIIIVLILLVGFLININNIYNIHNIRYVELDSHGKVLEPDIKKDEDLIVYLNNKYGNGSWHIIKKEALQTKNHEEILFRKEYDDDGYRYTISSSYLGNKIFNIHVRHESILIDGFLPTYYSIKYNLNYKLNTSTKAWYTNEDEFSELSERLEYVFDYLYPYTDSEYYGKGLDSLGKYDSHKMFCTNFLPNYQRIPEFSEWINDIGEYYSGKRQKNQDGHLSELIELVFEKKANKKEIIDFTYKHITPITETKNFKIKYLD